MLAIKIVAGALIGIISKIFCDMIERYLLSKRNLEVKHTKAENVIFFLLMAVIGAAIVWKTGFEVYTVYKFLILIICELIAVTDLHHRIIPNQLLLALLVIRTGLLILEMTGVVHTSEPSVLYLLIGLVAGFIIFALPALLSKSVGAGDIKLAATLGFCLGIMDLLYVIVLMGVCVIAYTLIQSKTAVKSMLHTMIPMGPFLVAATLIVINI